jgi:hypothetical protein
MQIEEQESKERQTNFEENALAILKLWSGANEN